jgi:diguanylate cyclase (GGDEF)-like protein
MTRLFLATAAAIYAVVFVSCLAFEHPGLGLAHFYYLAIALVALSLGPGWGAVAGGLATLLYMTCVLINHAMPSSEILTMSTPVRGINYLAIGALLGWFAAHYREANAELQVLAQRDLVTGLPNTRAFELAIDRRLASQAPFALLVGDLDAVEVAEDRGQALRSVADRLAGVLGPDMDLARVGAEELAVLTACDTLEHAAQLAVRLERTLCENGALVTFGWSAYPREGENALTLYRAADERLYARRVLREPRVHVPHVVGV